MTSAAHAIAPLPVDVPVDPDSGQAQQWIIQELSNPRYQAAQPNWFDRLSSAVWNWLSSLRFGDGSPGQTIILVIVGAVILAVIVGAFLLFGLPRLRERSRVIGALFGQDDARDATTIRIAAEKAASIGEWSTAIEEMFRAIARGLAERTVVTTSPGTTAHDFAARAGLSFPALTQRLGGAAIAFDGVRYLGHEGTEAAYREVAAVESVLRETKLLLERVPAGIAG